jgi:hypothetical protein
MTANVHLPTASYVSSYRRILAWLRLGTVTAPLLVVFFAMAVVQDAQHRVVRIASRGRDQGPAMAADAPSGGSAVLVPAEVWARSNVPVRQDEEASINRR